MNKNYTTVKYMYIFIILRQWHYTTEKYLFENEEKFENWLMVAETVPNGCGEPPTKYLTQIHENCAQFINFEKYLSEWGEWFSCYCKTNVIVFIFILFNILSIMDFIQIHHPQLNFILRLTIVVLFIQNIQKCLRLVLRLSCLLVKYIVCWKTGWNILGLWQ